MAVVSEGKEWAGVEDSDGEPAMEVHATQSFKRRESRIVDAATILQSEEHVVSDKQVNVHLAVRDWAPTGGWEQEDDEDAGPAMERAATESFRRRESRIASATAAAADTDQVLADKEVGLVTQDTDWAGAGEDSDDDGPVMELIATEVFKRRETRLIQAPDLHDDGVFGDVQLDIVPQGKEWAHADDSEDDSPARERHEAASFQRRASRLEGAALVAEAPLGDKEVSLQQQSSGWKHDDSDSSDDDGPVMELIATEVFRRRETRLIEAPELHDERVFGDVQLDVVAQGKEWAHGGDSDEELVPEAHATDAYRRRETRFSIAPALQEDFRIADKEVGLLAQDTDWRHGDTDSDDDGPVMDLVATEVFKRRETRLLNAPDLHDDRIFGDVQLDVLQQNQEWALDADSDTEAEQLATELYKRRESRIATAAVVGEDQALGDKDVSLLAQDTDWRHGASDSEDDGPAMEHRATETYRRRESRLASAPELHEDRLVGDVQVGVVDHGAEWAHAADSDDEPLIEKSASVSFQRRESRLASAQAAGEERCLGDKEVSVQEHRAGWRHDDSDDEGSPTAEQSAATAFERREKRLSVSLEQPIADASAS